jgi:hypothetical protein
MQVSNPFKMDEASAEGRFAYHVFYRQAKATTVDRLKVADEM